MAGGIFFNNVAQSGLFYNGAEQRECYFNNVLNWKKELTLFYNGAFGGLGTPVKKYVEGSAWQASQISGANWLINCDGRADWWFPIATSGYSTLNIQVVGREGAGQCFIFATTGSTDKWGVNAEHVREITTPGTYTLPVSAGAISIGVEALRGGVYISNMWLS